ncbi:NAD(P)H-hydrate dehydratase [Neobacillus terrae]|uniref:NAD(P)H-hydrate dehydratase n=1 Tax=Neobacillus terrae TaxID=3034837 RepID=UPI001FB164C8|nr:NAD(P)H-hydrate dehydratase [Neobacillus terrae]
MTETLAKEFLPVRPAYGHKGTFGHVLVLGGSRSFVGAPIFTAKAALNAGAGLVTLGVPESIYPLAAIQSPESLFLPLYEEEGHFALNAIDQIKQSLNKIKAIAVGPGMSRFTGGEEWMRSLFSSLNGQPIVVDADGLYLIKNSLDIVRQYQGNVIFTPHPGEMAVLLNLSVNDVEKNRIEIANNFAKENNIYLLLKGHRAIIASPDGDIYINPLGHDALGKGGSGDVLTGIVSAFLAQGASPIQALVSASYLHAKTGEEKAKTLSHYGVNPPDLIDGIREELKRLT